MRMNKYLWQVALAALLVTASLPGVAQNTGTGTGTSSGSPGASGTPGTSGAQGASGTSGTTAGAPTGGSNAGASPSTTGTSGDNSAPSAGTSGGSMGTNGTAGTGGTQGSLPAANAATAPQTYTLAQTISAALQSSSDLQTATRNVEIDRARADEAAAAARPNLNGNAQASRFDQATLIRIGSGPPVEVQKTHQEILSLNLGDRLDLTGQIRAASNQARLQSLSDQFVLGQIRNGRILRAKSIYFNLLRAQHQAQVAGAALATARTQQAIAQRLYAGQVGQKIDLLRANTQVANSQQEVNRAQNNLNIARSNFNDLVGRPLNAPTGATDVPGVTVGVDVSDTSTVGAATNITPPPFSVAPGDIAGIDVDKSIQSAYGLRPEILAAQVNVRVAETGITLARAGLEPTLSLNATGDYYPTTSFQFPRQRTAAITATLAVPLYDGGATRDRIREARLRTQNAQTTLDSIREDVALDVRQSYLNLVTAAQQIDAANAGLQQAIAARQLAQVRYVGGVGLYLEVTDAQSALVQAENAQVSAVYDYLVARAQFENAVGAPQTQ